MGRSYWFECAKCGYRATVSGRADRGAHFFVQTILCRDCRSLYDAVTRMRVPAEAIERLLTTPFNLPQARKLRASRIPGKPPLFQAMLARLPFTESKRFRWVQFQCQCPVSPLHRVQPWNDPDHCPKCGVFLEKNALPYRLWD